MDLLPPLPARSPRPRPKKWREFEAEALAHVGALYNLALRLAGDPADAEDLVQESLLKAYRAWTRYERGTNCRAWLLTILRNTFRDEYRARSKRRDSVPLDAATRPAAVATGEADPESVFFERLVDDEVTRAIDDLPEEQRTPVVLSDLEGLTYAEIATVMRVPVGTIRSRLFRARRRLRRRLFDYAAEMGYLPARNGKEPEPDAGAA